VNVKNGYRTVVFSPENRDELSSALKRLSELRTSGVDVRVGVGCGAVDGAGRLAGEEPVKGERGSKGRTSDKRSSVEGFPDNGLDNANHENERRASGERLSVYSMGTAQDLISFVEENTGVGVRVLISLDKMSSIVDVSKESFVLEVEGGALWGDVKEVLRGEGLSFPHWQDSMYEGMTIAELLMLGNRVRRELGYGKMRESVLALEIVTASGTVLKFGTRAVKNVVDYELIPFILEHGRRCGVITRAVLKLLPQPEKRVYLVAGVSEGEAREISNVLLKYLSPSFIEIISGNIAGVFDGIAGGCSIGEGGVFVVALVEGSEAVVEARLKRLGAELSKSSARVYCFGEARGERLDDMESVIAERIDRGDGVLRMSFEAGGDRGAGVVSFMRSAFGDGFVVVESFPFERVLIFVPVPVSGTRPEGLELIRDMVLIKKTGDKYACFNLGYGGGVVLGDAEGEDLSEEISRSEGATEQRKEKISPVDSGTRGLSGETSQGEAEIGQPKEKGSHRDSGTENFRLSDYLEVMEGVYALRRLREELLKKFDPAGLMEGNEW